MTEEEIREDERREIGLRLEAAFCVCEKENLLHNGLGWAIKIAKKDGADQIAPAWFRQFLSENPKYPLPVERQKERAKR